MKTHVTATLRRDGKDYMVYILWLGGGTEVTALTREEAEVLHTQLADVLRIGSAKTLTKLPPPAPQVPRRFA